MTKEPTDQEVELAQVEDISEDFLSATEIQYYSALK